EYRIGLVLESGNDDFFDTSFPRGIGDQLRINAITSDDCQFLQNLTANCHSERSKAESKNPAKLPNTSATRFDSLTSLSLSLRPSRPCRVFPSRSFLDFARNDVDSFTRGAGVSRATAQGPFVATPE